MNNRLRTWLTPRHNYENPLDRQRARALLIINWVAASVWFVYIVTLTVSILLGDRFTIDFVVLLAAPPAVFFVTHRSLQQGGLRIASRLFVLMILIGSIPVTTVTANNLLFAIGPVIAAGLLLDWRWLLGTTIVMNIAIGLAVLVFGQAGLGVGDWLAYGGFVVVMTALVYVFSIRLYGLLTTALFDSRQIEEIVHFSGETITLDREEVLLTRAINFIRDRLRYSYAQIYLLDEQGNLSRRARSGLGVDLVSVRENLNIGDANIISEAARLKKLVMVTRDEAESRRGHMLPAVNVAVALPILQGETVLGVVDVQSESVVSFSPSRVAMLTLLSNQLALVLAKTRESETLRRDLYEQELVTNSLRSQIQELRQLGRESVSGAWDEYLMTRGEAAVGFDLKDTGIVPAADLPEALRAALAGGQLHAEIVGEEKIINIPIMLRGQVLGAMAFTVPKDRELTQRQLDMAQNVSERLALSLETRRLFEQSQAQAIRERKANETAGMLISATDVRAVLNIAAESFNQALGAIHTRIYIKPGLLSEDNSPQAAEVQP